MIAVIVPAHNEAAVIGACLTSIAQAAQHPGLAGESVVTVVALDDCQDDTASQCHRPSVVTVCLQARCVGVARAHAAQLALAMGARWIASTDADSRVPLDWLSGQLASGGDVFCGMVAVDDWDGYSPAVRRAYRHAHRLRDGHRHVHGANLGISAQAYRLCGGFAPLACGEDVALIASVAAAGHRIAWRARPLVLTSARRQARAPDGFSRFLQHLEQRASGVTLPGG
jgi:glycosyltransferase involved in cell wall biosynthesis